MSFTCPKCGRISHHPDDLRYDYCGACHDFTGVAEPQWRAPNCPGCNSPPMLHFGGEQAFCGNDDCRVFTWDRSDDPATFKAKAQEIELRDIDGT